MRDARHQERQGARSSPLPCRTALGSVNCKLFLGGRRAAEDSAKSIQAQADALSAALKDGRWVTAKGTYRYDEFKREMVLMVSDLVEAQKPVRADTAPEKARRAAPAHHV